VTRDRFADLDDALRALRTRAQDLSRTAPRQAVDVKYKQFEPVQQVSARLELAGPQRLSPNVRAGIDVRGDGSTEAFTGRVRRQVIEQQRGEDAYQALGRAVRTRLG
jgi:hypothetical protein